MAHPKKIVSSLVYLYIKYLPLFLFIYPLILIYSNIGIHSINRLLTYTIIILLLYFSEFIKWYRLIIENREDIKNDLNVLTVINIIFITIIYLSYFNDKEISLSLTLYTLILFVVNFISYIIYYKTPDREYKIYQKIMAFFIVIAFYGAISFTSIITSMYLLENTLTQMRQEFNVYITNNDDEKIYKFIDDINYKMLYLENFTHNDYQLDSTNSLITEIYRQLSIPYHFFRDYSIELSEDSIELREIKNKYQQYHNRKITLKKEFISLFIDYYLQHMELTLNLYGGLNVNRNQAERLSYINKYYLKHDKREAYHILGSMVNIFNMHGSWDYSNNKIKEICEINPIDNIGYSCDLLLQKNDKDIYYAGIGDEFYKHQKFDKAYLYYLKECTLSPDSICFNSAEKMEEVKKIQYAKKLYEISCENNNSKSCESLAVLYFNGEKLTYNISKSQEYFHKACKLGSLDSCKIYKSIKQNNFEYIEKNRCNFLPFTSSIGSFPKSKITSKILKEVTGKSLYSKYNEKYYFTGSLENNSKYTICKVLVSLNFKNNDKYEKLYSAIQFDNSFKPNSAQNFSVELKDSNLGSYSTFGLSSRKCEKDKYFNEVEYCNQKNKLYNKLETNSWSIIDVSFLK